MDLPDASKWPTRPVYFCAGGPTKVKGANDSATTSSTPPEPLPLGKAIEFETDLFQGRMLLRLKCVEPAQDDKEEQKRHKTYFEGKKRFYQIVVQGRFKESGLKLSDVYFGDCYEKPFLNVSPGVLMNLLQKFMQAINPGMIFDIASDTPRVLTAFGSCQEMSVDLPGKEPNIEDPNGISENTALLDGAPKYASAAKRRKKLANPKHSKHVTLNPDHVYTFHIYDHTMDFGTYHQHAMGGSFDLTTTLNGQPLALCAITADNRCLYRFPLWHERLVDSMKKKENDE